MCFYFFIFYFVVPGGNDGPSGVLVCCENYIIYKNFGDQPDVRCPIPRRQNDLDDADRSMLIITSAMHKTKVKENEWMNGGGLGSEGGVECVFYMI